MDADEDTRGFAALLGGDVVGFLHWYAGTAAAIACYAKVGFRPVGLMRQYGRDRHGRWHDGLLLDLLAVELVR